MMITPAIRRAICSAGALTLAASWSQVRADTWGPPQKEHWSANKQFVLQVEDSAEAGRLSLSKKTDGGLEELWKRGYVDPVWPPHRAYVTNDGKYVVLRDLYQNLGRRKVIVILGDGGKILGSYELDGFLPQDEIRSAMQTVSSLWWNSNAWFSFINDDREFALATQNGTVRCFDLPSGKLLDLSDDKRAMIVDLVRKDAESWTAGGSPGQRIHGITLLAALRVPGAIPVAKKLFQDKTSSGYTMQRGKPNAELHAVQEAAALALVTLIGGEAIPIIEDELPRANWNTKEKLIMALRRLDTKQTYPMQGEVVQTPDSAAAKAMWMRLATSPDDDLRYPALCEVLRRDTGSFLLQHPELVESESVSVRIAAVVLLSKLDSPEALPLLRKAIADKQESVRRTAMHYYIARQPPDLVEVLLPQLDDESILIRGDAVCELVCRGHPAAIERLRKIIESWLNADLKGNDQWARRSEIKKFCKLIADVKPHEVLDSLAAIRAAPATPTNTAVTGALAALGDLQAVSDLHRIASEGRLDDRALAVEMCRYLPDEKSAALVKEAAEGSESRLRSAATEDIRRFQDRRDTPALQKP
jgi:HEAT repeat protein